MDILQIALILLIVVLGVFLSVLGIQVFFILKDLKKSLIKLDKVLDDAQNIATDLEKPAKAASQVTEVLSSGMRVAKSITIKPAKRLFRRKQ